MIQHRRGYRGAIIRIVVHGTHLVVPLEFHGFLTTKPGSIFTGRAAADMDPKLHKDSSSHGSVALAGGSIL